MKRANTAKQNAADVLSTGELARRAGLSREWVVAQIKAGKLRAMRTESGRFLVEIADAQAFMANRSRT